jgi:hypothetical protein
MEGRESRNKRCQFDTVGFESSLVEGHHPVDFVWVWAIIPRRERRHGVVPLQRIREGHDTVLPATIVVIRQIISCASEARSDQSLFSPQQSAAFCSY